MAFATPLPPSSSAMPNMMMLIGIDHVLGISLSFSLTRSENLTVELFSRKISKMDMTLAKRVWGSDYLPFIPA